MCERICLFVRVCVCTGARVSVCVWVSVDRYLPLPEGLVHLRTSLTESPTNSLAVDTQ